jgi:hypothetical protein
MKAIDKRVAALEGKTMDKMPYVAFAWGGLAPVIPPGVNEGNVLVVRRIIWEPPVRDAQDNIIEPARPWADDDPRYLGFASRERIEGSQLALATSGARDTLAMKLAAIDARESVQS